MNIRRTTKVTICRDCETQPSAIAPVEFLFEKWKFSPISLLFRLESPVLKWLQISLTSPGHTDTKPETRNEHTLESSVSFQIAYPAPFFLISFFSTHRVPFPFSSHFLSYFPPAYPSCKHRTYIFISTDQYKYTRIPLRFRLLFFFYGGRLAI